MALEADVNVFQQESASLSYNPYYTNFYGYDDEEMGEVPPSSLPENGGTVENSWSSIENYSNGDGDGVGGQLMEEGRRRKRRGARVALKNKEEVENQRMAHIAVERNRRKQMNDYLAVLRSIMPPSYAHRGDQASIVGGAINFVKELEQLLHSLKAHKYNYTSCYSLLNNNNNNSQSSLVSDFFTFPQYSTTSSARPSYYHNPIISQMMPETSNGAVADVEVSMVDGHANIKVLSRKQPKHLLKMVVGLQSLCLNILHLNVTTFGYMVLHSFSVKVDENCELSSVNEIAAAVYEMVERIQAEENCLDN